MWPTWLHHSGQERECRAAGASPPTAANNSFPESLPPTVCNSARSGGFLRFAHSYTPWFVHSVSRAFLCFFSYTKRKQPFFVVFFYPMFSVPEDGVASTLEFSICFCFSIPACWEFPCSNLFHATRHQKWQVLRTSNIRLPAGQL